MGLGRVLGLGYWLGLGLGGAWDCAISCCGSVGSVPGFVFAGSGNVRFLINLFAAYWFLGGLAGTCRTLL